MKIKSRIGVVVGGICIAFSTLCFFVLGVFTPAIILAALIGTFGGVVAIALSANRTGLVAFTFGLAPLLGFLVLEYVPGRVLYGYVVFVPLAVAVMCAVLAVLNYSKGRGARSRAA